MDAPFPEVARVEVRAPGGYRAVLGNERFRALWLSQIVSGSGEGLSQVAMPLLAYALTGSAGLLSLVFVVQMTTRVAFAPLAGVLVDRLDRRRLMIAGDLGRAAVVALLPFSTDVWQVAVLAILVSIGNALVRPAELATVPMVVPPSALVTALSVSQITGGLTRVVGPAAGAGLVGFVGTNPAFWVQAVCFLASATFLRGLTLPRTDRGGEIGELRLPLLASMRRDFWNGALVVWGNRVVRGITGVEMLWQLVTAMLVVVNVVYTEETLDLGDQAGSMFALLTATMSGGAVLGALAAGRVERRLGRRRLMAIGYLAPLALVPLGLVPPLWAIFACWFSLGFGDAWAVIAMQAYIAEAVPDRLRGRVYSTWGAVVTLAGAGWFALAGWLTPRLGAPLVLTLAGVVVGGGGPLFLWLTGALKAMRSHVPVEAEPGSGSVDA
jgi:NRE family putative nickel resistance protein-like MFS transporter